MPTKKKTVEEITQAAVDSLKDFTLAPEAPPEPSAAEVLAEAAPVDKFVYLEQSITWDYGAVKVTFTKRILAEPHSILEQHAEYEKLTQQLDFEHECFARDTLPKLQRYGRPIL